MPLIATTGAASAKGFGLLSSVAAPVYIEDVMSVFLYTGSDISTIIVNNGINLTTDTGLVWIKCRGGNAGAQNHALFDTVRGSRPYLSSNTTAGNTNTVGASDFAFTDTGFQVGPRNGTDFINAASSNYTSWTFRKQPKFFDVVTFTTSSTTNTNQRISHDLGSTPGTIILKATNAVTAWPTWHRSLASATNSYLTLNTTDAVSTYSNVWGSTGPTSTDFGINTNFFSTNVTYVAYLFAHDAGGFGASGSDNVISCGSFTTDGSGNATVTLGYEPQWILYKESSVSGENWDIADNMRGMPVSGNVNVLNPNTSGSENTAGISVHPNATGFTFGPGWFASRTFIYIAIRRGPMKTPTAGTSVFESTVRTGTGTSNQSITGLAFPPDLVISRNRPSNLNDRSVVFDKLRGATKYLITSGTDVEATGATTLTSFNQAGETFGDSGFVNGNGDSYINWQFRRAPGFFDVVCYTGTGSDSNVSHNLGVAPELIIIKRRDAATAWIARTEAIRADAKFLWLNSSDAAALNSTQGYTTPSAPTSTTFPAVSPFNTGNPYVAYLFASLPGVSKVGSYTGNGSIQTINCGFSAGARFVLIKRTDSTSGWFVWDTARGIVSANDPHLRLNSVNNEETADSIDPDNSGFIVNQNATTNINVTSATYIYLAIA